MYGPSPQTKPYAMTNEFLGFFSASCQFSASLPSFSMPCAYHTAGYLMSSLGLVPLLRYLVPPLCIQWVRICCTYASHSDERSETVISQSGIYQVYSWRQGWPFPLRLSQELMTSGQAVVQRGLGQSLYKEAGHVCYPVLCFLLLCFLM